MPQASEAVIEEILQPVFGDLTVRRDADLGAGENSFDVFGIPDDRIGEFMDFCMDSLASLLADRKLEPVSLIPHGAESSARYYPEISSLPRKRTSQQNTASVSK